MTHTYAPRNASYAPAAWTLRPATDRALAWARTLIDERVLADLDESACDTVAAIRAGRPVTGGEVSHVIDSLKGAARLARVQDEPRADAPKVPAGHYAVADADGVLKFYRIDTPDRGRWAGYTFVKVQASDDYYPVRGAAGQAVLAAIAVDVMGALTRYGHEIGRCGICNRTLTDEESRARGIGPICAAKL